MNRGLTVTGTVTDEEGGGATVRTKFQNDIRQSKTGDDGNYQLVGCEALASRIVVSAKGRATEMKLLTIDREMAPVDFRMKPGGTVRVRVLDDRGNPSPKARILFQWWRGPMAYFEFNDVGQYADAGGNWEWHEAPLDEFRADIRPAGPEGMQLVEQPLIARAEEYVFRLPPSLIVSGKVVDAATKESIKAFRVVPGIRSTPTHMNWVESEGFTVSDGRYQFRQNRGYLAHMLRIEADGYRSAVSRDIGSTEGNVTVDFALERGAGRRRQGPHPGPPTRGSGQGDARGRGKSDQRPERRNRRRFDLLSASDCRHRGPLPVPGAGQGVPADHHACQRLCPGQLVARLGAGTDDQSGALDPGGRHLPGRPDAGGECADLARSLRTRWGGGGMAQIFNSYETTTGPDGRFAFERVIPGRGYLGRRIMLTVNDGALDVTSSCMIGAEFPAGKTVRIDLGGTGRPVVGKLRPREGFEGKVRWNFALVEAGPAATGAAASLPSLTATIDRDGTFRIDDVPAGDYSLRVGFRRDDAGSLYGYPFKVPATEGEPAAPPVDLGTLTLKATPAR